MLVIVGAVIVLASVLGGFIMAGGHPMALVHMSEFVVICGSAAGALVIMAPQKVLMDLVKGSLSSLKGNPYKKTSYEELFKALYELFVVGRRNGMIALEEHVMEPKNSTIFSKYPDFIGNAEAVEFVCDGMRPVVDGKVKPEQLKSLLDVQLETMEEESDKPVGVLSKIADSMPGFGIVAAVLGIIITMGAINGPIDQIGHKVAAALVGTFLGILVAYGFLNPLAVNLEFMSSAYMSYYRSIATCLVGFANGLAPIMAIEVARRKLPRELQPKADELEAMLKSVNTSG